MKASSSTAEAPSGRAAGLRSNGLRSDPGYEKSSGQVGVRGAERSRQEGEPTCYLHRLHGRGGPLGRRVLSLAPERDRCQRAIHGDLEHAAPHALAIHGRHVAARRPTLGGALKLVLLRNLDDVGAVDLNLLRTGWKKDEEEGSERADRWFENSLRNILCLFMEYF